MLKEKISNSIPILKKDGKNTKYNELDKKIFDCLVELLNISDDDVQEGEYKFYKY